MPSTRPCASSMASPACPRASIRWTSCSARRSTGSPTGVSPATRTTTDASSTSTTSPPSGWSVTRSSRPPTSWSCRSWERARSQRPGSITRMAAPPMADLSYAAKRLIMQVSMAAEIIQLGQRLDHISERNRLSRDFTLASLVRAIREVIAAFPVYRTYVGDDGAEPSARDRAFIERAIAEAERRNPTVNVSVFDFVRDALLLWHPAASDAREQAERRDFVMRFQQMTGPITAKGVEDTALYV